MPTAEVRICNRALARIGQTQQITSLDQANSAARACKALFADSRDATLEAHDWPFARRRATLAAIADGERGSFAFAYTLPDDCISPRFIEPAISADDVDDDQVLVDPTGVMSGGRPVPFELEDDEALGTVLLTDQEDAELVYTARVEAVPRWTANFLECLSMRLAADLALSVSKRPQLASMLEQKFEKAVARAASLASKHRKPRARPPSFFERNR
jgi:hypothetical protein